MKLSIIGTGYIVKRFLQLCHSYKDIDIQYILTRRDISRMTDFPFHSKLTNCPDDILKSEIVFEACNDANWAVANLIDCAENGIKIATFDADLHVQFGKDILKRTHLFTECLGDQPGCFAKLRNKIISMGLSPYSYINYKRYMNYNPEYDTMKFYSNETGNTIDIVTASTDGTKVAYETCLIANAFNLEMYEYPFDEEEDMDQVIATCKYHKDQCGSDSAGVWVNPKLPKGIAILAEPGNQSVHDLNYLGLMVNDTCLFEEKYHLCQYDIIDTLRDLYYRDDVLLNTGGNQTYNVYSVAKTNLKKGTHIKKAMGSFQVRGKMKHRNDIYVPLNLMNNVTIKEDVEFGSFIRMDQVQYKCS